MAWPGRCFAACSDIWFRFRFIRNSVGGCSGKEFRCHNTLFRWSGRSLRGSDLGQCQIPEPEDSSSVTQVYSSPFRNLPRVASRGDEAGPGLSQKGGTFRWGVLCDGRPSDITSWGHARLTTGTSSSRERMTQQDFMMCRQAAVARRHSRILSRRFVDRGEGGVGIACFDENRCF